MPNPAGFVEAVVASLSTAARQDISMASSKFHLATLEHEVAYQEIADLLVRHADNLSALEVLAVAANLVGKLIAMQDQRTVTRETALGIVAKNIEFGNSQVVDELANIVAKA